VVPRQEIRQAIQSIGHKNQGPTNAYGIEKYLSSGIIKGIRESTARKLVKAFGKNVFDVFDNNPERILTVDGITKKQAERIINSWAELRSIRTLIEFLCEHGITPAQALRIHRRYHNEAIDKIKNNPYGLVYDIRGIGFATADRIAQSLGIDRNSPLRARAGSCLYSSKLRMTATVACPSMNSSL